MTRRDNSKLWVLSHVIRSQPSEYKHLRCVCRYYLTQICSESQRLSMFLMPSYLQLSFQLPPITPVLLLFIHNFFLLSPSPLSPLPFTYLSHSYITSLTSVVCPHGAVSFLCSPHSFFILPSLTNIPSPSCSAPVIRPLLNPRTSSAANPSPTLRCSPILWM